MKTVRLSRRRPPLKPDTMRRIVAGIRRYTMKPEFRLRFRRAELLAELASVLEEELKRRGKPSVKIRHHTAQSAYYLDVHFHPINPVHGDLRSSA